MNSKLPDKEKRSGVEGNALYRYYKSFINAVHGIVYAIRYEHNFIIIVTAIFVTTVLGFLFNISTTEWAIIVICFGLVSACELINSSIEACVDLVSLKHTPLGKIAKDCASGATLIFSIMSLIVAIIIFIF